MGLAQLALLGEALCERSLAELRVPDLPTTSLEEVASPRDWDDPRRFLSVKVPGNPARIWWSRSNRAGLWRDCFGSEDHQKESPVRTRDLALAVLLALAAGLGGAGCSGQLTDDCTYFANLTMACTRGDSDIDRDDIMQNCLEADLSADARRCLADCGLAVEETGVVACVAHEAMSEFGDCQSECGVIVQMWTGF